MRCPPAVLFFWIALCVSCQREPQRPVLKRQDWFKITLGASDTGPTDWSGSLETTDGRIVHLSPWRFLAADSLDVWKHTWTAMTRPGGIDSIRSLGLYAGVEGSSALQLHTPHGVASFSPDQVAFGGVLPLLSGRVVVERAVQAVPIASRQASDPAVGGGWVAWVAEHGARERLMVSRVDGADTQQIAEGEFFAPFLAAGEDGRVHLVVSQSDHNTWRIALAVGDEGKWTPLQIISDGGPDLMPRAVVDAQGDLRVVWQSWREGRSQIMMRRWNAQSRQEPVVVSDNRRNAWAPSIAADSSGQAHIVWDASDDGPANVYYRAESGGAFQPQRRIGPSALFETHATVAVDANDNVWLAWNEFQDREKDVKLRVGKWGARGFEVAAGLPPGWLEQPQLVSDHQGNVWCLVSRRDSVWDYAAMRLSDAGWSMPITLSRSGGELGRRAVIAPDPDNSIRAAWEGPLDSVFTGWIPSPPTSNPIRTIAPEPVPAPPPPPQLLPIRARLRDYRIATQGKSLRVLRGAVREWTGSIIDAYRDAIDTESLDWLALNSATDWEMVQKAADLFHYPGRFTPLYALRHVIWAKRPSSTPAGDREDHARRTSGILHTPSSEYYTMLLAENNTRGDLIEALRARHSYTASADILLDVRAGDFIQGDVFATNARPKLSVVVEAAVPVDQVEVLRGGKPVFVTKPGTLSVKFDYADAGGPAGENRYEVRALQRDGKSATSSPIVILIRYNR